MKHFVILVGIHILFALKITLALKHDCTDIENFKNKIVKFILKQKEDHDLIRTKEKSLEKQSNS